jgi:plasmid maintenance system antidote protein VapI
MPSPITHLVTGSTKLTPKMALADAANFDLSDVLVVGYQSGELVVRSSEMTRAQAVFMLLAAVDHARATDED